jgi:quercetin dioxygenase-like cupin family protein
MTEPRTPLDQDIVDALVIAQREADADSAVLARVRVKLMQGIAADTSGRHVTVAAEGGQWRDFLPGIQRKVLHEQGGLMSYLLKFAPGAVLPAHRHPVDEECLVLEGRLRIGELTLDAGGFHLARQGVPHGDIESLEGAVIYLHGAAPKAEHLL